MYRIARPHYSGLGSDLRLSLDLASVATIPYYLLSPWCASSFPRLWSLSSTDVSPAASLYRVLIVQLLVNKYYLPSLFAMISGKRSPSVAAISVVISPGLSAIFMNSSMIAGTTSQS